MKNTHHSVPSCLHLLSGFSFFKKSPFVGASLFLCHTVSAQDVIIQPVVEETETIDVNKYSDYIEGLKDYDVSGDYSVKTFKAVAPASDTVYIPLGTFNHGNFHRLAISASGANATSAAEYTFTVNATSSTEVSESLNVHQIQQTNHGSRFQIYAIKDGNLISLILKYTNIAPAINSVTVNHTCQNSSAWKAISDEALLTNFLALNEEAKEGHLLKGNIELHDGGS